MATLSGIRSNDVSFQVEQDSSVSACSLFIDRAREDPQAPAGRSAYAEINLFEKAIRTIALVRFLYTFKTPPHHAPPTPISRYVR